MYEEQYALNHTSGLSKLMVNSPSILDSTKMEIDSLEKRLADKKELARLLEEEPKAARIIELIKRTGF